MDVARGERGGAGRSAGLRERTVRTGVMTSVVHFHFRNAKAHDMVKFDGDHVSLQDLKLLIAKKKGLAKAAEIDFAITNSETAEGAAVLPCACAPVRLPPGRRGTASRDPPAQPRAPNGCCESVRCAGAVVLRRPSNCARACAEYTDPAMFIPKDTRVEVRKVNVKAQAQGLKDAPDKEAR